MHGLFPSLRNKGAVLVHQHHCMDGAGGHVSKLLMVRDLVLRKTHLCRGVEGDAVVDEDWVCKASVNEIHVSDQPPAQEMNTA